MFEELECARKYGRENKNTIHAWSPNKLGQGIPYPECLRQNVFRISDFGILHIPVSHLGDKTKA
jgi:hypothetical protein